MWRVAPLAVVTVIYFAQGAIWLRKNPAMCLVMFAYGLANIGLIWADLKG